VRLHAGASRAIRVFICDDVADLRALIKGAVEGTESLHVVGEAGDGAGALAGVLRTRPDVVLLDISMPDVDGLEVLRLLRERAPGTRVVIFSALSAAPVVRAARELGAHAYVVKGAPLDEVTQALLDAAEPRRQAAVRGVRRLFAGPRGAEAAF
jgi:DNA-binding NarL/FixJ family response regulator